MSHTLHNGPKINPFISVSDKFDKSHRFLRFVEHHFGAIWRAPSPVSGPGGGPKAETHPRIDEGEGALGSFVVESAW